MAEGEWEVTTERFVLFFDILGFKDLVQRNTHEDILNKLTKLRRSIYDIEQRVSSEVAKTYSIKEDQVKSTTFSDSIIFFSRAANYADALAILFTGISFIKYAVEAQIPLKGAFSYGRITVDFSQHVFFGQPIIDAYLLHDEIQVLWAIADHHFEKQIDYISNNEKGIDLYESFIEYSVPLKLRKVNHKMLTLFLGEIEKYEESVRRMYMNVSGSPRVYIDNTLDFLKTIKEKYDKKNA